MVPNPFLLLCIHSEMNKFKIYALDSIIYLRKIIVHYIIFFIVLHNNNHLYLYLSVNLYFCFIRSSDKSILQFKKSYNCCDFVQIQFTVSYHFDLKWNFSKYHYSITSISNYKLFGGKNKLLIF